MQQKFIVTGVNGFLGSNLAEQLLARGHRVCGTIVEDNTWSGTTKHKNLQILQLDITDVAAVERFFKENADRQTIVIHSAGLVSIASRIEPLLRRVNVDGARNIFEACQRHRVKRLVYISSVHAIPELPHSQTMSEIDNFDPELVVGGYAKTKAIATQLAVELRQKDLDVVIIHPSGLIGPGDWGKSNIKQAIVDYLNRKLTAIVKGGYDFADVRDVAAAIIAASLLAEAKNRNYILSNQYFSMRQIIGLVDEVRPKKHHHLNLLPTWFIKIVASMAEVWYKLRRVAPTFTWYSVYALSSNSNFSHQKATDELNYHPRPMKSTISDAVAWYESRGLIR